jgi:hypothetical protein
MLKKDEKASKSRLAHVLTVFGGHLENRSPSWILKCSIRCNIIEHILIDNQDTHIEPPSRRMSQKQRTGGVFKGIWRPF